MIEFPKFPEVPAGAIFTEATISEPIGARDDCRLFDTARKLYITSLLDRQCSLEDHADACIDAAEIFLDAYNAYIISLGEGVEEEVNEDAAK